MKTQFETTRSSNALPAPAVIAAPEAGRAAQKKSKIGFGFPEFSSIAMRRDEPLPLRVPFQRGSALRQRAEMIDQRVAAIDHKLAAINQQLAALNSQPAASSQQSP
jgi:hypothetical protein